MLHIITIIIVNGHIVTFPGNLIDNRFRQDFGQILVHILFRIGIDKRDLQTHGKFPLKKYL